MSARDLSEAEAAAGIRLLKARRARSRKRRQVARDNALREQKQKGQKAQEQ